MVVALAPVPASEAATVAAAVAQVGKAAERTAEAA